MKTASNIRITVTFLQEAFKSLPKNDGESPVKYASPTITIVNANSLSMDREAELEPSLRVALLFEWDAQANVWIFQSEGFDIING